MNLISSATLNLKTKVGSLLSHAGFRKYFANTSWLMAEKVLRMVVGLFVGVWVARYLGPEKFGLLSYAQSFVALFSAFATLGLDGIVVRELVKNPEREGELLGTSFGLKLIGALAVFIMLAIAIPFTSNDRYTNILVFIIASATIFQAFNVVDMYFQAKVMGKFITFANTLSLLLSSIAKVVFILVQAPLIAFAWMVVFESFVLAIGYVYFYVNNHSLSDKKHFTFKLHTAKSLLKDSWPLILSGLVIMIYMRIDQVMIKEMLGAEAVGQYAAAVRISEAWYFIPMVISSSLFPAIINAKKQSEELYYARLQKLYDFMVWFGVLIVLPLWFFSDFIIITLFGTAFANAIGVFEITIFIVILIFIASVHGKWLLSEGLQRYSLFYSIMGVISNIVANLYFIPKYGIVGAAYGTVLAQTVPYLLLFRNSKTRKQLYMMGMSFLPIYYFKRKRI